VIVTLSGVLNLNHSWTQKPLFLAWKSPRWLSDRWSS